MLSFGQLFGSNFWSSFKPQPSESIEKLLKKEDLPIEELLDDNDLLQECKNSNKNLINYLDRDKLKQLINFITVMPEEDEHKRGHKYPFLASEVFNCDMGEVIDMFFRAPCDDAKPEPEEHPEEDEDATKIDSHFEKDDDSGSDSEEEGSNDADSKKKPTEHIEEESHEDSSKTSDLNPLTEEITDEKSHEVANPQSETQANTIVSVEFDVEDKVEEKKVGDEEVSDSSKTEDPKEKLDQTDEKLTQSNETPSCETKDTVTEVVKETHEDIKKDEATELLEEVKLPETPAETHIAAVESHPTIEETHVAWETQNVEICNQNAILDDDDTVISEATTEISAKDSKQKQLSSNKYDLLDYLVKFIDTEEEINDVLAGYFARLFNLLIQKKGEEIARYIYSHEELLYRFAYHSYSKSISEIAIKILDINIEKIEIEKTEISRIRGAFLNKLLEKLKTCPEEVCYEHSLNIFQIFNELTYKKAMDNGSTPIKYYDMLIEQHILNTLGEILTLESPECSSNAAIRILNVLISHLRDHISSSFQTEKKVTPSTFNDSDDDNVVVFKETTENSESQPNIRAIIASHPLVEFFKSHVIDYIVSQLDKNPENCVIDLQYGTNQYTLGKKRLAIINLMESLVELDDEGIRAKILETSFYTKLFDLFLEFPFNTFLHLHVDNIFHCIIKDASPSATIESKLAFLTKLMIFKKLPAFWTENQMFSFNSTRTIRHSYLAFTTKMANTLRELAKSSPEVAQLTSSEEWAEFHTKDVEMINEKNAIVLATRGNRKESSDLENLEDDDDKFKELEERDDLEDKDDEEDDYSASRNSMRDILQTYDPSKARDEHEQQFIGDNIEKDEEEDNLFSGLNARKDEDSDEDKPIEDVYDNNPLHDLYNDEKHHDDDEKEKQMKIEHIEDDQEEKEHEKDDVSESSGYYDNSYWQINQFNIEDLLRS